MKNNERIACLTAAGKQQPVLQSVHASGEIRGLLLRMKLRQQYRNTGKEELETVYSFPLAWGTTLLGMRVTLNGKKMTGAVIAKQEAEEKYEDAISAGDLPVMLVSEGKDLYSARLGNLKPGDEALIEIEYGQLLKLDQGRLRLTVPTTIAPRFGKDPGLQGLAAHAQGAVDPLAGHRFLLEMSIHGPLARGRIACPSHAVSQQANGDGVRVSLSQKAMLDRDFVLAIDGLDDLAGVIASPEPEGAEGCTLLASFVARPLDHHAPQRPLKLKMLLDCSGSMAGDSMRLAREALGGTLDRLRPDDCVTFSRFGSQAQHLIRRLIPAEPRHLVRLKQDLATMDADLGGTELDDALRQVIKLPQYKGESPEGAAILLVTDGDVWDIDAIVATVRASGHVVYALGVGSSPAESLLRELAGVTGGACEFVAPNEDMEPAVERLICKMRSAQDFEIAIGAEENKPMLKILRRSVAPGEMVHVWCQLPGRLEQTPRLTIAARGGEPIWHVDLGLPDWEASGLVARMGAAQRLIDITDDRLRKEVALKYQLLTAQTNFFLVHERAQLDKASGVPELQQVGSMMAAGWGGMGTVGASFDCLSEPMFSRRDTGIRFGKNPSPRALTTPAVWRREASSGRRARGASDGRRVYASLAQVAAHPDEPDNPLRQLLVDLDAAGGAPSALQNLLERLDADARDAWITSLLDHLSAVAGSRPAALAVVVDWAARQFTSWHVSRRGLRPAAAILKTLPENRRTQALELVALVALGPADPLPEAPAERYDIPAFLRKFD